MPTEARGTSKAAAKAFARYYIDVLNYATSTGDTSEANTVSAPDCESCIAMLAKIDAVYANGGYFEGDGWSVTSLKYQPLQPKREPVVSVGIVVAPQHMLAKRNADIVSFEGGRNRLTLRLSFADGMWSVRQLDRLS